MSMVFYKKVDAELTSKPRHATGPERLLEKLECPTVELLSDPNDTAETAISKHLILKPYNQFHNRRTLVLPVSAKLRRHNNWIRHSKQS